VECYGYSVGLASEARPKTSPVCRGTSEQPLATGLVHNSCSLQETNSSLLLASTAIHVGALGELTESTRDAAGNIYGTTATGGTGAGCAGGCGLIYKLDPLGNQTILYTFSGGSDGDIPLASLVRDGAGNLYSTTFAGGASGFGTVFKLDASGNLTTLYSFQGASDGGNPSTSLIRDEAGNLYGTAEIGGTGSCFGGCGVIFRVDSAGNEVVLHSFMGSPRDGKSPFAGLVADSNGVLYSTTDKGRPSGPRDCVQDRKIECGCIRPDGSHYWKPALRRASKAGPSGARLTPRILRMTTL
jgi:uncharacterized repeat protein (TIGR03803 family)